MSWHHWLEARGVVFKADRKATYKQALDFAKWAGLGAKSRRQRLVWLRYCFWSDLRGTKPELSLADIGEITGHDHASVLNGLRNIQNSKDYGDVLYKEILREYKLLKEEYAERDGV